MFGECIDFVVFGMECWIDWVGCLLWCGVGLVVLVEMVVDVVELVVD